MSILPLRDYTGDPENKMAKKPVTYQYLQISSSVYPTVYPTLLLTAPLFNLFCINLF